MCACINVLLFNLLLERDIVKSLLPIVLDIHRAPHLTHFLQVLRSKIRLYRQLLILSDNVALVFGSMSS